MIEGYTGLPGAGKTYLMSARALKSMKSGRPVWANYPLRGARYYRRLDELFPVRDALILLDEAGLIAPAGAWGKIPWEVLANWREHRHLGNDLIFTAQDSRDVAVALRRVVQYWYRVRKFGPIISFRCRDAYGAKYNSGFTIFDGAVAGSYDTAAMVVKPEYLDQP